MSIKNWPGETCCVYSIRNKLDGRQYIGVTKNSDVRFMEHSRQSNKHGSYINRAINKHGRDNFDFQVLLFATREYCLDMEAKLVQEYDCLVPKGYNLCAGGRGRISVLVGESHPQYGKRPPQEAIEKMRQKLIGRKNGPLADEHKRKLSEAAKVQWADPEKSKKIREGIARSAGSEHRRACISKAQEGRLRTEDQKRKHSEVMRAKWADPEFRARAIAARQNRSPESYQKQSETVKQIRKLVKQQESAKEADRVNP